MRVLLPLGLLAILASLPLAHAGFNGLFSSPAGVAKADVTFGVCESLTALSVTLTPLTPGGPSGTRSVQVKNARVPDPCSIACYDCPFAWAWALVGSRVQLAGSGVSPGGFTLQGAFQDGVLEFGSASLR